MHIDEKWYLKGRKSDINALAEQTGVSKRLAALLAMKLENGGGGANGRSLAESALEFLSPDIGLLYDGMLMKDMDRAVSILCEAAVENKKTLVIGDYDVDGIMGVLILCRVLGKSIGGIGHCIPHRIDDGYGINDRMVREAHDDGVKLIVTCDNGISAYASIALAKSLGMGVIITDHHELQDDINYPDSNGAPCFAGGALPPADAVVNPKRPDCGYPFKDLCGAAVAYKLADAFAARMGIELQAEERDELLSFAAVATICDIVGLVDENRRIVYHGLKKLNAGIKNTGLSALVRTCGLTGKVLSTYEVGHIIGPCINAAGRLDSAEISYNLFIEPAPGEADKIAAEMLEYNRMRQDLTAKAFEDAAGIVETSKLHDDKVIVVYMPGTHESICGIVAGKLKDKYARPAIVLTDSASGELKGSGRSVEGYDLLDCIKTADDLWEKYGGHKMAVGVSIERVNLPELRGRLSERCALCEDEFVPKEMIDICLGTEDVTMDLVNEISRLEPFGRGNEKPVFAIKRILLEYASLIGSRRHVVKMRMRPDVGPPDSSRNDSSRQESGRQDTNRAGVRQWNSTTSIDAVFFGDAGVFMQKLDLSDSGDGALIGWGGRPLPVDVTFSPEINDYNGVRKVQMIVRSIRKAV